MSSSPELVAEIIEAGRRLYEAGLIIAAQGNISVRTDHGLLATAGGVCKGLLTPDLILETDFDGRRLDATQAVSSEVAMHAAIYRRRSDIRAIVHAHPPAATAFAVAGLPLDHRLLAETALLLGPIPLVPYAPPSTAELADAVGEAFGGCNAALLANHGAVAAGDTLQRAQERMETLEHLARVTLLARTLGEPRPLSAEAVERLLRLPTAPYR